MVTVGERIPITDCCGGIFPTMRNMTTRLLAIALSASAVVSGVAFGTATATATASEVPFYVAGGLGFFAGDLRKLTDQRGYTAAIGWGDQKRSLVGMPSLDLSYGHVAGQGNKFDSLAVMYSERIPLADSVYLGAGVGSFWNHLSVQGNNEQKWTIGARGSAGLSLGSISSLSPFVEITWFYPLEKTMGVQTDYLALVAGFWF